MSGSTDVYTDLNPSAKRLLESIADRHGMTQQAVITRLTKWFIEQDAQIQVKVLKDGDAARLVLERLVGGEV